MYDRIVYHELEQIEKGAIRSVSRVMDLQCGGIMAVKIIHVESGKEKARKGTAKAEVEILARCEHIGLSFLSCLRYLLRVIYSGTLLALCTRKGWGSGKPVEIFHTLCQRFFARLFKYQNGEKRGRLSV